MSKDGAWITHGVKAMALWLVSKQFFKKYTTNAMITRPVY